MFFSRRVFILSAAGFVARCGDDVTPPPSPPSPQPPASPVTLDFSFATNFAGWEASYADYTLGQEGSIGFAFGHEPLPSPLGGQSGIFLSSNNVSDDVFMYVSRLVDGLAASRPYRVDITITLASNTPPGCVGIGGAPGEAVAVKAGATAVRPENVVQQNAVRVNFDKGNQAQGGANAVVLGNLAQEVAGNCLLPFYRRKTLSAGTTGPVVTSDASGRLWLVIGTDSGFEGLTKVYFLEGTARLTPV